MNRTARYTFTRSATRAKAESPASMPPAKRKRTRSGELAAVITIGVIALIVVTGNFPAIVRVLYSPYAAFVAVVMLVEYIILKGADRSALYRRELEATRAKRRDDLLAMRKIEAALVELDDELAEAEGGAGDEADKEAVAGADTSTRELARIWREKLRDALERLRSRI